MTRFALAVAALPALALAACGQQADDTTDTAQPEPVLTPAAEMTPQADFAIDGLGAKIVGPQGPEVSSNFTDPSGQPGGTVVSYVACPAGMDSCDPTQTPTNTVYTFVHTVTPANGASAFRTAIPAYGFTGSMGFDEESAAQALGEGARMVTRCQGGQLTWAVEGGQGWLPGRPITVWWQSNTPPAGPAPSYEVLAQGDRAAATGPYTPELPTVSCG